MADGEGADSTHPQRGKTVHGEAANAGHRVLAPDDAEVEAYLETALKAPAPDRSPDDRPDGATTRAPGTVVVLDFGSQFAQLIARRVRELDVYSELLPHDTPYEELERRGAKAIILSGGPMSVYDTDAPRPDPAVWNGRIPVLGICYGAQLMAHELGGDVLAADRREYGPANVSITTADGLFQGIDREQPVWMSHADSISRLPAGFSPTAQTDSTPFAGLVDASRRVSSRSAVTSPMIRMASPGPGNGWRWTIVSGRPNSRPTARTSSLNRYRSGSMSWKRRSAGSPPTLWWVLIFCAVFVSAVVLSMTSG